MNGIFRNLLFILLLPVIVVGQSSEYMKYHKYINKADSLFGNEQFEDALNIYDSAFKEFEPAFVRDYLIAAQIATITNSDDRITFYLEKALKWGYPCDCVESLPIFEDYIKLETWETLKSNESEYRNIYASNVSLKLNNELSIRYRDEQDRKSQKVEYVQVVKSNYSRIKFLIDSLGFPSENNIGLDDGRIAPNRINQISGLETCTPSNQKVIVTLLHYDNPITNIGLEKFVSAIELGLLHPRDFAYIFTFEKNNISRISSSLNVNKPNLPDYDFNFPFGSKNEDYQKVNGDRAKFGICSLEIDQKVKSVQKKYKFNIRTPY